MPQAKFMVRGDEPGSLMNSPLTAAGVARCPTPGPQRRSLRCANLYECCNPLLVLTEEGRTGFCTRLNLHKGWWVHVPDGGRFACFEVLLGRGKR